MSWLRKSFSFGWKYRSQIFLTLQLLKKSWKTAKQITEEYIRHLVRTRLKKQIKIIAFEILLLFAALVLDKKFSNLATACIASVCLWGVTLYNLHELFFRTVPEILEVRKALKGRVGYTMKYVLQISLAKELLEWNVLFLGLSLFLAFSSRTYVASGFSYLAPWESLFGL